MALAAMFYEPMVKPLRDMLADVEARGLDGPEVQEMQAQLRFMEQLAQQVDDIGSYTGRLAQENTFQRFSEAYSRALAAAAQRSAASGGGTSDEELLASTLAAYESTLQSYAAGQAGEQGRLLLPFVQRIVELGRSGLSYPQFLRQLEVEGLTRALEGAAPAVRDGLCQELAAAQAAWRHHEAARLARLLAAFDELAAAAPFGQPDPLVFALLRRRQEWDDLPLERRWAAEIARWQQLLALLVDWLDAFTSFAPWDQRWRPPGASEAQVRENIARTQQCGPGELRFREALFARYFGRRFEELWRLPSFEWEYAARRVEWSDERLQLIVETHACCAPGAQPPAALVARAEALHPDGDYRAQRLQPPPWGTPPQRFVPRGATSDA